MTNAILVKKLNKEVRTLRRDVTKIKSMLLKTLTIPQESVSEYSNAASIRRALRNSQKSTGKK